VVTKIFVAPTTSFASPRYWQHTRLYGVVHERTDERYRELSALATIDTTDWSVSDYVDHKVVETGTNALEFNLTEFMHSFLGKSTVLAHPLGDHEYSGLYRRCDIICPISKAMSGPRNSFPRNVDSLVLNEDVDVNWIEGSNRFWYRRECHEGKEFVYINAEQDTRSPAKTNKYCWM
jgi:hypothetical protein